MSYEQASITNLDQPFEHLEGVTQIDQIQEERSGRLHELTNKALGLLAITVASVALAPASASASPNRHANKPHGELTIALHESHKFKPIGATSEESFYNWAGYQVDMSSQSNFDGVVSSVDVPSIVSCGSTESSDVALWAGIGDKDPTVATDTDPLYQAGVWESCEDGTITYTPFYQVYPDTGPELSYYTHSISPGDELIMSVGVSSGDADLCLTDYKYGSFNWSQCKYYSMSGNSTPEGAECITERTTFSASPLEFYNLSDFDSADFGEDPAYTSFDGRISETNSNDYSISSSGDSLSSHVEEIQMDSSDGDYNLATTSDPARSGEYTVNWDNAY